ncbi:hypothetical protein GCM10010309_78660 [Streptomyces violaceochromogenes]|nr:hypothetical protein GCM10010309_78660 [Streptomyces violaceochromogenes]
MRAADDVVSDTLDCASAELAVRVSNSAADRIIGHLGPALALQQRKRFPMASHRSNALT